eukprot:5966987-Prymnesium_polylepis.1
MHSAPTPRSTQSTRLSSSHQQQHGAGPVEVVVGRRGQESGDPDLDRRAEEEGQGAALALVPPSAGYAPKREHRQRADHRVGIDPGQQEDDPRHLVSGQDFADWCHLVGPVGPRPAQGVSGLHDPAE